MARALRTRDGLRGAISRLERFAATASPRRVGVGKFKPALEQTIDVINHDAFEQWRAGGV